MKKGGKVEISCRWTRRGTQEQREERGSRWIPNGKNTCNERKWRRRKVRQRGEIEERWRRIKKRKGRRSQKEQIAERQGEAVGDPEGRKSRDCSG